MNRELLVKAKQHGLWASILGSLLVGCAGVVFAIRTGAEAILLDGLFNLTYFATGLFSLKVAALLTRGDDAANWIVNAAISTAVLGTRLSGDEFILVAEHRPSAQAGEEELAKAEAYLMERLTTMKRINDEMMPEVELYRDTHREWDAEFSSAVDGVARARAKYIFWSRAHRKIASGITDPAKWFDISEAPALLFKAGKKALL